MLINKVRYPEFPNGCITQSAYIGTQDYDTQYLGYDRQLPFLPKVALSVMFENPEEVSDLMDWWAVECKRGVEVFILETTIFGVLSNYGMRFISPLVHKIANGDTVSFTVEILFDVKSLDNLAPTAIDMNIVVGENTRDNYILLKGIDPELDGLTYEIILPPAYGTIRESGRVLLYTPGEGYKDKDDCLNFVVKDRFNISKFATVGIHIGDTKHVESEFIYTIASNVDKFILLGNYHWQYSDVTTNTRINYGTGETIPRPLHSVGDWELRVWSNDNEVGRDSLHSVTDIQVINWGKRTNYEKFFGYMPNIDSLTTVHAKGSCQGINFDYAFYNFPLDIPEIDTRHGMYFRYTFHNTTGRTMPKLRFDNAKYCQGIFEHTKIKNIPTLVFPSIDYAQDMFKSCDVFCLEGLDVKNAISTGNIMLNSKFAHQPSATLIHEFDTDQRRSFHGAVCGVVAGDITLLSRVNAILPTPQSTKNSVLKFKIAPANGTGAVTCKWHTSAGTLTNGTTTTPTLTIPTRVGEHTVTVWCDVTDTKRTITSAKFTFRFKGVADYLELNIPRQTEPLNLTTFIKGRNPANKKTVYLLNDRVNCQFITGNFAGLNVTLQNTGEIQAFSREDGNTSTAWEKAALIIEGPLTLNNRGWIRGCGGKGGTGGKGSSTKHKKEHSETKYAFGCGNGYSWGSHGGSNTNTITWGSKWSNVNTSGSGPVKHPDYPGALFYKGSYKCSATCDVYGRFYAIRKVTFTWHSTTGGNGGVGGRGRGYGVSAQQGAGGSASNPRGGNSGARGGYGGDWGKTGNRGHGGGTNGKGGGRAIIGKSHLKSGSYTGSCSGAVT